MLDPCEHCETETLVFASRDASWCPKCGTMTVEIRETGLTRTWRCFVPELQKPRENTTDIGDT